jgi:hypothetical protein
MAEVWCRVNGCGVLDEWGGGHDAVNGPRVIVSSVIRIAIVAFVDRETRQTRIKPSTNAPRSHRTEPDLPRRDSGSDLR